MSWALPEAILFLLGLLLLFGYFLSRKVFPNTGTDAEDNDPSGHSPCDKCGEPGCGGFAKELLRGGSDDIPGGDGTDGRACPRECGSGDSSAGPRATKAVIRCRGTRVSLRYHYSGAPACRAAARMAVRPKECVNACLGFGDCVRLCPRRAIHMVQGIARVDPSLCDGCGHCLGACPLDLIVLIPAERGLAILCKGPEGGASSDGACPDGCTDCGLCIDACPEDALVRAAGGLPEWIEGRCTGCGLCVDACPRGVVILLHGQAGMAQEAGARV